MSFKKKLLTVCALPLLPVIIWAILTPRPPLLDNIAFSTVVLDRQGRLMRLSLASDERYRVYTPLGQISPALVEATLLYEDKYFRSHPGVNPAALARAIASTCFGERRMGASTITMQLARLRLGLDTGTIVGKLRQMERALAYELHYSKDEILEAYFNLAPYGGNIEGCGAASRIYYHKAPDKLSLVEALSLVSVPQNPSRRNPLPVRRQNGKGEADSALEEAQQRIFKLWVEKHPEDAGSAFLTRARLEVFSPATLPFAAPHVSTEGILQHAGPAPLQTTIDYRMQRQLERMLSATVERSAPQGVRNASALLVHWPSMEVRALVGSADFFNQEIEGQVDGTRARRSPGSTLKPFIYALGLDQGLIHPRTLLYDTPRSFGGYDPENADQQFRGPLSATEALRLSRNIPAIGLAGRLGKNRDDGRTQPDLYDFLKESGVAFDYGKEHYGLALVLGGAEVSMRELAKLYAMLANRGVKRELRLFSTDAQARPEPQQAAGEQARMLSPEACVLTLDMLRNIPGSQGLRNSSMVMRVPMYWKTGTSNGYRDAWTAGIFGPYVLVVWVGNFDNTPNLSFVGAHIAAPLFWEMADAVYAMEKIGDAPMQNMEGLNIKRVKVCSGTGDLDTRLCRELTDTLFIPGVSPIADSGVYRQILIDKATGLRACVDVPGETSQVVWEFWPTDLQRVFRSAGIMKPAPPPFLPECGINDNPGGIPPEIISPKPGVVYHRSLAHPEGTVITLHAAGDADVTDFFWFSGAEFIGRSSPSEHLVWTPPGGTSVIRVVDNFGRGQTRKVVVELTE